MTPEEARRKVRETQASLDPVARGELSVQVVRQFLNSKGTSFWKGQRVAIYHSLPDEIQLGVLENTLKAEGAELFLPRISDPQKKQMEMAERGRGLIHGPWGLVQPDPSARVIDPLDLNWIFVPGLAFGENGERVGRGQGYYDRYLVQALKAKRIALVFDFQVFSELEQSPWDQQVDEIWTETRSFICPVRKL